jgi:tetratricopeptide (TPR) repeat protein
MRFGDRLREERLRRLLSQEELAEVLGVSRRTITRWEHHLALPRSFAQQQLSQLFGLNPQEFLKTLEAQTPPSLLWTVPYPRNPFFTGREEILHLLHSQLTVEQPIAPLQALALCGLGGIGKTQIAIEYAHRYASEYRAVFWLAAETVESLMSSIQQIAEQLQLPERQTAEQAQVLRAVQRWLDSQEDWLLIADNVEDLDLLETVLPSRRQGAVLLTTRQQAVGLLAQAVQVSPLNQQESVSLLLARARLSRSTAPGAAPREVSSLETSATRGASELVTLLEGLPLAVDQAGAYIEETGCRVMDYLSRYQSQRKHVLARRGRHAGGHPASVSTTLHLSVQRIAHQQPAVGDLLYLCAFLHPEAIPEELFSAGASHLGPTLDSLVSDPYQFDLALAVLRSASLVTRSPQSKTFSLHRLVQAVLVDQMEPAQRCLWSERAIRMVNAAFPEDTLKTWALCERLLTLALACVSLIAFTGNELPEISALLFKAGSYLMARGRYREADPLLSQAVALAEQQHGTDHLLLILRLDKQAELFWNQGKYEEAERVLQRMLVLEMHYMGQHHSGTAETLSKLAVLYASQGKYEKAEPLYQRALHIQRQQLGHEHFQVSTTLNNLAYLYWRQGKYGEAESLYKQALSIWERQLDPDQPEIASPLTNLANLYREQGRYEEAEPLYKQALCIREQRLGSDHPYTGITINGLANLYREQGKYEEAEPLYRQALTISEQQLGVSHPQTTEILADLATLYREQGKYEEAEPLYRQALTISEQQLGVTHPKTRKIRDNHHRLLEQRK